jgi:hypothetical protein
MSVTRVITVGVYCGLAALVSATLLLWLEQSDCTERLPRWLRLALSLVACSSMLLYGSSLIGSLYLAMSRCVPAVAVH